MPTYEYVCSSCGNAWEEIQKITEPAVEVCPSCQKATAKRQISGGTFILKGGGWYSDLYSSTKPAASKDDASKSTDKGDAKTEKSGSETKTEAKAETKSEAKSESTTETKKSSPPKGDGGGSSGSGGASKAAE